GASSGKCPAKGTSEPPSRKKYLAQKTNAGAGDEGAGREYVSESRRKPKEKELAKNVTEGQRSPLIMKELCEMDSRSGEDKNFTVQMIGLSLPEIGTLMMAWWDDLLVLASFWNDKEIATAYARGALHPTVERKLYWSPFEERIDQAIEVSSLGVTQEWFPKGWAPLMGYNEDIYTCGVEIGVVPRCLIGMEPLAIKQVSFCVGRCLRRFPGPHSRLSTVSTVYWVDDTT
ncbi:hypothetical protein BHM03_00054086, partial [Ensete ventricosum]